MKKRSKKNFCYKPETNYTLNYITLRIRDKEINKMYLNSMDALVNSMHTPVTILALISFTYHLVNYLASVGEPFMPLLNAVSLTTHVLWMICKEKKPSWSKRLPCYYMLIQEIMTVLLYWDKLGPFNVEDKRKYDSQILFNFILANAFNVSTIQWTMCSAVIPYMIAYSF